MKATWDFHEWTEFADRLGDMGRFQIFAENATKEIADVLLKLLKTNTPVDYGTLKAQWDNDNVNYYVTKTPRGYQVILTNSMKYAVWVNDGHRQRPGRFIPGYWVGNHFRYDPNANGGMVLKKPWVKGRFFVEISIAQIEASTQMEQIIYKHLQNWWKGCLNG